MKTKLPLSLTVELVKVLARVSNYKLFKRYLDRLLSLPKECSTIEEFYSLKDELFVTAKNELSLSDYQCFSDFSYLIIQRCEKLINS